jgi:hypothetical protein
MPFSIVTVPKNTPSLEITRNSVGAFSLVVMTTPMSSLTQPQQTALTSYLAHYAVRLVILNDKPNNTVYGMTAYGDLNGAGDVVNMYIGVNGVPIAKAAGLQDSLILNTAG